MKYIPILITIPCRQRNADADIQRKEKHEQEKNKMIKSDPIIAVKDVEASSEWYQKLFGCRSRHGGKEFDILVAENDEVIICLHQWGAHGHPTMAKEGKNNGSGLILYFRADNMETIRENAGKICGQKSPDSRGPFIEEDVHLNQNSLRKEFSLRDPDGYYLTITGYHEYEG